MAKYRKKPVVIDALKWDGENTFQVMSFMGTVGSLSDPIADDKFQDYKAIVKRDGLPIETLEGTMTASVGDYIINGIQGEFYPCKPDIFEQSYESVK